MNIHSLNGAKEKQLSMNYIVLPDSGVGRMGAWEGVASPASGASFALPTKVVPTTVTMGLYFVPFVPAPALCKHLDFGAQRSIPSYSLNFCSFVCAPIQTRQ